MRKQAQSVSSAELQEVSEGALEQAGLADPALAYDYFKSMVSLSVATLGGVLTLGEAVFGSRLASWQMGISALSIATSGLLALQGQTDIMQLCQGIKPPLNSSRLALRLVPALYGLGLGMFVAFVTLSYLAPNVSVRLR